MQRIKEFRWSGDEQPLVQANQWLKLNDGKVEAIGIATMPPNLYVLYRDMEGTPSED